MMEGVNLRSIVSTFVNVTMYLQHNNNMLIKTKIKRKKKKYDYNIRVSKYAGNNSLPC
jgi:hypothetical protein